LRAGARYIVPSFIAANLARHSLLSILDFVLRGLPRPFACAVEVYCMPCCTGSCAAAARFDSKVADRDLRRYQRSGPDVTTRILLSELRRWPLEGLNLLDVGGGIGVVAVELAGASLASVTLADASAAYLEAARRNLASRDPSPPAQFILGDFAVTANSLPDADIVTLDRVVCCYPDMKALLAGAAAHARCIVAFTYPRDRWYVRAAVALENSWYWISGNPFRTFVHSPEQMSSVLESAGLVRAARRATLQWALEVYCRPPIHLPPRDNVNYSF
jgi:magnesium-protoporphyrin O-methyltransferase